MTAPREATIEQQDAPPACSPIDGAAPYLIDIQDCLLKATASVEEMIFANMSGDADKIAAACCVVAAETKAANGLAALLSKRIVLHQRRKARTTQ